MNRRLRATSALLLAPALLLAGCASESDTSSVQPGTGDEITIEHAFGETTIPEVPENVVTWGWGSADAAIALGVIPVAIPAETYAGDAEGVLPWISEALDEAGAETPTILPNAEEPPYDAIAAESPDVIIAPYSGITEEQYDLLSEIAPTVAYPDQPWATDWRDIITITGEALGRADEADALLGEIDATVAAQAEAHPEFEGKTAAMVWDSAGSFYVYTSADPRLQFLSDLGFVTAPSVDELATGESSFFYTLSYEQLDQLTSDVLVSFADTPELAETFAGQPYAQTMEQVQSGAVANVVGTDLISSVSPPTALSIDYALEDYVTALSEAVAATEQ